MIQLFSRFTCNLFCLFFFFTRRARGFITYTWFKNFSQFHFSHIGMHYLFICLFIYNALHAGRMTHKTWGGFIPPITVFSRDFTLILHVFKIRLSYRTRLFSPSFPPSFSHPILSQDAGYLFLAYTFVFPHVCHVTLFLPCGFLTRFASFHNRIFPRDFLTWFLE